MRGWWGLLMACALIGCTQVHAPEPPPAQATAVGIPVRNLQQGCVADFAPGRDYFPEKTALRYSRQLRVMYGANFKRVTFTPAVDTGEHMSLLLVQCGTPVPTHSADEVVVQVPVTRLATANASLLGALEFLGHPEALVGLGNKRALSTPRLRERLRAGAIHQVFGWGHGTIEPILALRPSVYFTFYSAYPEGNLHRTLWSLGVRAVPWADHMEGSPLGRADWMRLLAMFLNAEAQADAWLAPREARYATLQNAVTGVVARPVVMTGLPSSRDRWELPGAENFRAQLIRDAGGRYAFDAEHGTGSLQYMPMERALLQGGRAQLWFGGLNQSTGGLAADTPLGVRRLPPVLHHQVWALDAGGSPQWAAPAESQGMARPDDMLEDAIRVIHPGALPPGEFHFARALETTP